MTAPTAQAILDRLEKAERECFDQKQYAASILLQDARAEIARLAALSSGEAVAPANPLLQQPQYIIEGIILRRLHEKRIEGYTIETAKEIASALSALSSEPVAIAATGEHLAELVARFSAALLEKLRLAEQKYGYDNGWMNTDWRNDCQRDLLKHLAKGDPRDVAAYCAFMWHHGWPTIAAAPSEAIGREEVSRLRRKLEEIHEISQDVTVSSWAALQNVAATAASALSRPTSLSPDHPRVDRDTTTPQEKHQ